MNRNLKTETIVGVVLYLQNNVSKEEIQVLPTKLRWNLKKNLDKILPIAKQFQDFKDEVLKEIQEKYFTDEKSELVGKDSRKVKDEYIDEYKQDVEELNKKLNEILDEDNEIEIATVDLDAFVDSLPNDTIISFDTLEVLSFMDISYDENK